MPAVPRCSATVSCGDLLRRRARRAATRRAMRARGLRDLLAAAVADGEDDGHAGVVARWRRCVARSASRTAGGSRRRLPIASRRMPLLHHLAELAREVACAAASSGRRPRAAAAASSRSRRRTARGTGCRARGSSRRSARTESLPTPMAVEPRQAALLRPAAVAVHDDRDVARQAAVIELDHQTAMISSSLVFSILSTRSTYSLRQRLDLLGRVSTVVLGDAPSPSRAPSASRARRGGGCAPRRGSPRPACGTCFTRSRRRSSVSGGIGTRMSLPSFCGLSPRSDAWIAFSMSPIDALVERLDDQQASARARRAWPPGSAASCAP